MIKYFLGMLANIFLSVGVPNAQKASDSWRICIQ